MTTRIGGPHIVMERKYKGVDLKIGQHVPLEDIKGRRFNTLTAARKMLASGFVIVRPGDGRVMAVK